MKEALVRKEEYKKGGLVTAIDKETFRTIQVELESEEKGYHVIKNNNVRSIVGLCVQPRNTLLVTEQDISKAIKDGTHTIIKYGSMSVTDEHGEYMTVAEQKEKGLARVITIHVFARDVDKELSLDNYDLTFEDTAKDYKEEVKISLI